MVLLQLVKKMQSGPVSEATSSSPESGESSGHSLNEVVNDNDWKDELVKKNRELHDRLTLIHSLEEQLKLKESEIYVVLDQARSVELDRDKSCQMVRTSFKLF